MSLKTVYVIVGTTASGKSELALQVAEYLNGAVVNADCVQVYQDIPLLTARPSATDMQGIPHHLYGFLDCYQDYNVADWLTDVVPVLENTENPVVVGGTGMYIKCLTEGINEIPEVDPVVREKVRLMPLDEVKSLVKECKAIDSQRLRRALEVQLTTGKTLAYFQAQPKKPIFEADYKIIWINRPREEIRQRCATRFDEMLKSGAVDEVRALQQKDPTGGVTKAIGYKEICSYLNGEISYSKMRDLSVIATCQYAKRQQTWFKHQLNSAKIVDNNLINNTKIADLIKF